MTQLTKKERKLYTEWSKALRSGEYKQAPFSLKTTDEVPKFCCLGVICDISKAGYWNGPIYQTASDQRGSTALISFIQGFDKVAPALSRFPIESIFMDCNDSHGMSFDEIADIVDIFLEETKTLSVEEFITHYA